MTKVETLELTEDSFIARLTEFSKNLKDSGCDLSISHEHKIDILGELYLFEKAFTVRVNCDTDIIFIGDFAFCTLMNDQWSSVNGVVETLRLAFGDRFKRFE